MFGSQRQTPDFTHRYIYIILYYTIVYSVYIIIETLSVSHTLLGLVGARGFIEWTTHSARAFSVGPLRNCKHKPLPLMCCLHRAGWAASLLGFSALWSNTFTGQFIAKRQRDLANVT